MAATNVYAPRALDACGLPRPPLGLVTSNDVVNGKPFPDPYLAGARRLGVEPANCELLLLRCAVEWLTLGRRCGGRGRAERDTSWKGGRVQGHRCLHVPHAAVAVRLGRAAGLHR